MCLTTETKDNMKGLKATDWLRLPSTCFLFGMIAGVVIMAVLVVIFIC